MKKIIFTLIAFCTVLAASAQHYEYSKYDVGVSVVHNTPLTDFHNNDQTIGLNGNLTYNYGSPYVNFIAEMSLGKISGRGTWRSAGDTYSGGFVAPVIRAQIQPGSYINVSNPNKKQGLLKLFLNTYSSIGLGALYSKTGGSSLNFFVPIKVGYEHKIYGPGGEPNIKIDIGMQYDSMFSDSLDAFETGKTKDALFQIVFGLKFRIGEWATTNKLIL